MKPTRILLLLLTGFFLISAVSAYTNNFTYQFDGETSETYTGTWYGGATIGVGAFLYVDEIINYQDITYIDFYPSNTSGMYSYRSGSASIKLDTYGGTLIGNATSAYYSDHIRWNIADLNIPAGVSGPHTLCFAGPGYWMELARSTNFSNAGITYGEIAMLDTGFTAPIVAGEVIVNHAYNWYNNIAISDVAGNTNIVLTRNIGGIGYESNLLVEYYDYEKENNTASTNRTYTDTLGMYPLTITLSFIDEPFWSILWYGDEIYTPIVEPTPTTPPLTVTVTATPTPRQAYCGFWTATPNTTMVARGGTVNTILTEADPANNFDKIVWSQVLPNGAKVIQTEFVNDPGLFGLGAGWVQVDPITNNASSSSLAAATNYNMSFSVSGKNHIVAEIYDDKSLLRTVYSSYEYVCGIDLDINVGGPSGIPIDPDIEPDPGPDGIPDTDDDIYPEEYYPQIGINVWEQDTKAIVYDTTICVYSYDTGEWVNKTNGAGGATTYFYVTPLTNIRVYVSKSPWVVFDQTFRVANPPGTYGVYLKRPMTPTGTNTSFVVFAVKASEKLFPLSGATIKISNATFNTTIVTNSAGGAQTELPETETYNYVISRYGYLKVSNYFAVTTDDLYMTITMNIDPENPPEYVQPTWTEIIIQTGATTAPTGTSGISPVGTGTEYRANNLETGINIWYDRFAFLQELFFLVVVVGALGLMMKAIPGGRGGRRR